MGELVLVGGGAASGKSAFALDLADSKGGQIAFIATAEVRDDEMRIRVKRHQQERQNRTCKFQTFEIPLDVSATIRTLHDIDTVVVDCLGLWLTNLLMRGDTPEQIQNQVDELCSAATETDAAVIIVANEVGLGLVPESTLGRQFRDSNGRAVQAICTASQRAYFAVFGTILQIKPSAMQVEKL